MCGRAIGWPAVVPRGRRPVGYGAGLGLSAALAKGSFVMRKTLPDTMFGDPERSRLTMLRSWVLDHKVSEIEMSEKQFWNFAQLQPLAEKPWATFMGRVIYVPDMPVAAQKQLGIFDKRNPGAI